MKKIIAILLGVTVILFYTQCRKKDNTDECPVCPKIESFTPYHGKYQDTVYIEGKNFATNPDGLALKVNFNGMPAKYVNVKTDEELVAVVPLKCGTGPIRVYYDSELYGESENIFTYDIIISTTSTFAGQCAGSNVENTDKLLSSISYPDKLFLDEPRGYVYFVNESYDLCRISSAGVKKILTTTDYIQGGACDASANIYLAFPEYIGKVETGVGIMVKSVAGLSGSAGHVDATGSSARFSAVRSIAADGDNLYIGESTYLRKLDTKTLAVTTVAGTATSGFVDGPALTAKFSSIASLSIDKNKNLYIADWNNNRIRKYSNGTVSTVAGDGTEAVKNGIGTAAQLQKPRSVTVDYEGKFIYFSDSFITSFMRKVNLASGEVSHFSGDLSVVGSKDGLVEEATYHNPLVLVYSKNASAVYVADNFNCKIRKITVE